MRFGWLTLSHSPSATDDHAAIEEQLVQACLAEEVGFDSVLAHRAQLHRRGGLLRSDPVRERLGRPHPPGAHRLRGDPARAPAPGAPRRAARAARQPEPGAPRRGGGPRHALQRVRVRGLRATQRRQPRAQRGGPRDPDPRVDRGALQLPRQVLPGEPARAAPAGLPAAAPAHLAQRGDAGLVHRVRPAGRADPDLAPPLRVLGERLKLYEDGLAAGGHPGPMRDRLRRDVAVWRHVYVAESQARPRTSWPTTLAHTRRHMLGARAAHNPEDYRVDPAVVNPFNDPSVPEDEAVRSVARGRRALRHRPRGRGAGRRAAGRRGAARPLPDELRLPRPRSHRGVDAPVRRADHARLPRRPGLAAVRAPALPAQPILGGGSEGAPFWTSEGAPSDF